MKKISQNLNISKSDTISEDGPSIDNNKTTNINILLNRVRLDKKKVLKQKIFFTALFLTVVSAIVIFFII